MSRHASARELYPHALEAVADCVPLHVEHDQGSAWVDFRNNGVNIDAIFRLKGYDVFPNGGRVSKIPRNRLTSAVTTVEVDLNATHPYLRFATGFLTL
jgi:hypothetical protein